MRVIVLVVALGVAIYAGIMGAYMGVMLAPAGLGWIAALVAGLVALVAVAAWSARRFTAWRPAPWIVVGAALVSGALRLSPWT